MRKLFSVFLSCWIALAAQADQIMLVAPTEGATVPLLNEGQKKYKAMPRKERIAFFASAEKRKEMKKAGDHQLPVKFVWTRDHIDIHTYTIRLATNPAFQHSVLVYGDEIDNLRIATTYYWKVIAQTENGTVESGTGVFKTEDCTPRLMAFDNVHNVRDMGGYKTTGGKRVRQGLVYRSAGLNDNAKDSNWYQNGFRLGDSRLTARGKRYIVEQLGVKTDLDLRSNKECRGMTASPLGPKVTWIHIPSLAYAGLQKEEGKEAFQKAFRIFLDKRNYPIVVHCIAGQDRTGSLVFILKSLLGVSEEDLYLDWEYTVFTTPTPILTIGSASTNSWRDSRLSPARHFGTKWNPTSSPLASPKPISPTSVILCWNSHKVVSPETGRPMRAHLAVCLSPFYLFNLIFTSIHERW